MNATNLNEAMVSAALDAMVADAIKYGYTRGGRIAMPPSKSYAGDAVASRKSGSQGGKELRGVHDKSDTQRVRAMLRRYYQMS